MNDLQNIFHDYAKEDPPHEGCFLVVVKEDPEVFYPEDELDNLIVSLGGTYYSMAYWDGDEWRDIYIDNIIFSQTETDIVHVLQWASRDYIESTQKEDMIHVKE